MAALDRKAASTARARDSTDAAAGFRATNEAVSASRGAKGATARFL